MRFNSISTKLLLTAGLLVSAGAAVTTYLSFSQSRATLEPVTQDLLLQAARYAATDLGRDLSAALALTGDMALALDAAQQKGMVDRDVVNSMLRNIIQAHPEWVATYTMWEPNAFDGKDAEFSGTTCNDASGRMLPYWNHGTGSGEPICEVLVDYATAGPGDYYILPRNNLRPTVIEPYIYPVAGRDVLITSLVTPIVRNGQVPGQVGVDMSLEDLQKAVNALKPLPDSYARLLSASGSVMADPDPATVGKPFAVELTAILAAVSAGQHHEFRHAGPDGAELLEVAVPISIGQARERFTLILGVPTATILAPLRALGISISVAGALTALLLAIGLYIALRRTVLIPIGRAVSIASSIASGHLDTPIDAGSDDETGQLMRSLDAMQTQLRERIELEQRTSEAAQRESDQLNRSVMNIMTVVAELAQKRLDVKVPVSEDVTGALSDAINLLSHSTAGALGQVQRVSNQVSSAAQSIRLRTEQVDGLARAAADQAGSASTEILQAATALRNMGNDASGANTQAERALKATGDAMELVRATVDGISGSRDQIRETEKRVKRLAERSQEITVAVNIIGQIAERTSVLALNASMQAVAAGEAGRGFAVVADEVKRLAENARQATQQIGGLVNAIQADTADAIQTMNSTIAQVVDISKLAETAGGQMRETRAATEQLVASVRSIAAATLQQGDSAQTLLTRAGELLRASQRTIAELEAQRREAEALSGSAQSLVRTVGEFRLPASIA